MKPSEEGNTAVLVNQVIEQERTFVLRPRSYEKYPRSEGGFQMRRLLAIMFVIGIMASYGVGVAQAYYCQTNCWVDYFGNQHCNTFCF